MRTMKTLTSAAALMLLASLACPAFAAVDKPGDYAYAMPLTVSARNGVVQLRLPKEVYLNSRSAQLYDVRVFDAAGKVLPHAFMQAAPRVQARIEQIPVKLFPVPEAASGAGFQNDVEIRTSADGAVTSVTTRHGASGQTRQESGAALVLDLGKRTGADDRPVNALIFMLPDGADNYQAEVQLEVSDDLQHWETAGFAHLSRLRNANLDVLQNNRMEFSARRFRYARLSWRHGRPVQFTGILAEAPESTEVLPALDNVTLQPHEGLIPGELVYEAGIAIPVRRMRLDFSEPNIVMPVLIGSHVKRKGDGTIAFAPRRQATFFKINQDGQQRTSGELALDDQHAQAWVVRPLEQAGARPQMTISWAPESVVFLASGSPPYTLHVGRPNAAPGHRDLAQVAPGFAPVELQSLEQAVPGKLTQTRAIQAGEEGQGAARLRIIALWSVLLLGVAVLAFMAWRLLRQMKEPE
jgi:hypothetical protein